MDNTPHLTEPSNVQRADWRGDVTDQHPQNGAISSTVRTETRRPVSRVLCRPPKRALAIIPLDRPSLDGSRDLPGPLSLRQPCRRTGAWSLFGLAPGGACHAVPIAGSAVRSYRTLSPLPGPRARRSALCGAIPGVAPGGRYPPPCRRGARTFLPHPKVRATARPSGSARTMVWAAVRVNRPPAHRRVDPSIAPSTRRDRAAGPRAEIRAAPTGRRSDRCPP